MPRSIAAAVRRDTPVARRGDLVRDVVRALLDAQLPAMPIVDADGRLIGIFGEREFMSALFPGYVGELKFAGFLKASLDEALEQRSCLGDRIDEHVNTEHVDVDEDASDMQIAEVFLHHRVLLIPVTRDGRVVGAITRRDFFRALAERALDV